MNRNMMRQAQKQLAQLQKIQEELETLTVEGSAGGGAVKVVMTGKQIVESVTIEPEAAEEVDLLQ
ncbi:MAG: YbaB/EbfC family nucleoid-associated protein, partial [Chloroflexi bacterium]|nr:YbaB/EbfC family nucleoid-associated protein [Chloroflexota bacterium]